MAKVAYFLILSLTNFCTSLDQEPLNENMWNEILRILEENPTDTFKPAKKYRSTKANSHYLDLDPNFNDDSNYCRYECVPFYLCRNGTLNTDGTGILDIRQNTRPCSNFFEVCCRPKDISVTQTKPTPKPTPTGCGFRRPDGLGIKIVGDQHESQIGEFPWMVAVLLAKEALKRFPIPECGGSLIHPRAVLTVAHCVSSLTERLIVRAGDWDISTDSEPYPHQDVRVKSVKVHPKFVLRRLSHDIAFLYLESPVKLTANVDVICLPSQNQQHLQGSSKCIVTGWGRDSFYGPAIPHKILKKLQLPLVSKLACQRSLRTTRLGFSFKLHKTFMCAGGGRGEDACSGDGGSPLVCPMAGEQGRYYQAGIVSWGIGCGVEGVPGVYVDVSLFRDWIDQQLGVYGLLGSREDFEGEMDPRFGMRFDVY